MALWRLFEQQDCGGVISFITASSYLAGPGFIGMREVMRRTFDEIWVLDLGGDSLGTRKTPNVFAIRTPVAITIGVRARARSPDQPAAVHYAKISGDSRDAKLRQLAGLARFSAIEWETCPDDWPAPFLPAGQGDFFNWPTLTDVFPLSVPGAKFHRTWPIGETADVLRERWRVLTSAPTGDRAKLFRETRDRKYSHKINDEGLPGYGRPSIAGMDSREPLPNLIPYGFRSFDRQSALYDSRLGDFIRSPLGLTHSPQQIFLASMSSKILGRGPAITASAAVPDLDYFCGRGGKDIIPLFRDAGATAANITAGLADALAQNLGHAPAAADIAAYVYAVLGGQSYTSRFWNELETPGPRVPVTKNGKLFASAVTLGRELIWLHTYAQRFQGDGLGHQVPPGTARNLKGISSDPASYPEDFAWDAEKHEVRVGDGLFGPVTPEVWAFEVSGLKVVQSWLGYRMKKRSGKKSSPLDDIRPEYWTARMTDEFLELLWVLQATLDMEPRLSKTLDDIVAGPCFTADELPAPTDAERSAPRPEARPGELL